MVATNEGLAENVQAPEISGVDVSIGKEKPIISSDQLKNTNQGLNSSNKSKEGLSPKVQKLFNDLDKFNQRKSSVEPKEELSPKVQNLFDRLKKFNEDKAKSNNSSQKKAVEKFLTPQIRARLLGMEDDTLDKLESGNIDRKIISRAANLSIPDRPSLREALGATVQGTLSDIGEAAKNVPASAGNLFKGIVDAVSSPIDTAKSLGGIALGAVQKIIPGEQDQERFVDALSDHYENRFGSIQKARDTFVQDPVGFLSDTALVLSGAGGVTRAGSNLAVRGGANAEKLAKITEVGQQLGKAGASFEPVSTIVGGASSGLGVVKNKISIPSTAAVEDAVKQIAQGKTRDLPKVKRALEQIDTTGVKTFKDLNERLSDSVEIIGRGLDDLLDSKNSKKLDIADFGITRKSGETTNKINFLSDAINALEELYDKTSNIDDLTRIQEIKRLATKDGITIRKANEIAREFGTQTKSFSSVSGQPLTSISAEKAEVIRKGIKDAVRSKIPGDEARLLDKKLSDLLNTRRLVERTVEKVNNLESKVQRRNLPEKVAGQVGHIIDALTLNTASGFLTSLLLRSNVGAKSFNYLKLQENLPRNLKIVDKVINAKTDSQYIKALKELEKISPQSFQAARTSQVIEKEDN